MAQKTKLTNKEIVRELYVLERLVNALNTAVVSLSYIQGVKGNELDKVTGDEYADFVQNKLHKLMRRADEIVSDIAKSDSEEIKKEVDNLEKEGE